MTLDVGARLLTRADVHVPLPPKTFELLVELVRRAPGVVRRRELLDAVWAHELVSDEALTQRVMLLRRALGDDPREPTFIASEPRWGYRIVAHVERLDGAPDELDQPLPHPQSPPPDAPSPRRPRVRARWREGVAVAAALAVVSAVVAGRHWLAARTSAYDSLAIVPFVAVDDRGNQVDYLCDELPTALNRALRSSSARLRVIAESAMAPYRGTRPDPRAVHREFGVRAVLTGTLFCRGSELVIDAVLMDAENGTRLWDAHIERPATDILAVQDEITAHVVEGLRLRLSDEERTRLTRRPTTSANAYTLYLKGRHLWGERSEKGSGAAIACFRAAINEDPSFALAYSGLAACLAAEGSPEYGGAPPREVMPRARALAHRALDLDAGLAEAHAALGLVLWLYDWRRDAAERELRQSIELDPGSAASHQWLAELLAEQGRADEADRELEHAQDVDPISPAIGGDRALFLYYRRQFAPAVDSYGRLAALEPAFVPARLGLGLAYAQLGAYAPAVETLEASQRFAGDAPAVVAALGYARGVAGRTAQARAALDRLLALRAQRYVSSYYVAGVLAGLGDRDGAFAWLEKACDEHARLLGTLKVDPAFDTLRADPRFPALLARIGLAS